MARDSRDSTLRFFATAAKGAEMLLADELRALADDHGVSDASVAQEHGGVSFAGPLALGYRACLWSRLAQRVLLRVASLALDGGADAFWEALSRIDWPAHLSPDGTLAVDFAGLGTAVGVTNTLFGAQRTKDIIVDQFRARFERRPSVDLARPDLRVNVYVGRREAVAAIDLSGESLHRRGYRTPGEQAEAPLKETLAAAILVRAGWPAITAAKGSLVDPLCGSATLPIEAALMAADVAPGLLREAAAPSGPKWGFSGWLGHDAGLWHELVAQAGERRAAALAGLRADRATANGRSAGAAGAIIPVAFGFDRDARAVTLARADVARAGLGELVHIERRELSELSRPGGVDAAAPGLVVANPPYGHRLGAEARGRRRSPDFGGTASHPSGSPGERQEPRSGKERSGNEAATSAALDPALAALYGLLGERLRTQFAGWTAAVLVNDLELGKRLGLRARRANRFMNGPLPCTLLRFEIDERATVPRRPIAPEPASRVAAGGAALLSPAADQFANRLRKNARRWSRFMRRAGVTCYRVYDADLPDFALAIDVYERWVHVQEHAPPPEIDEAKAAARLAEALRIVPEVLEAAPEDVFLKVRTRQRGAAQYARRAALGVEHEVHERDLSFLVNFTDYLDTGLFLPGREVRRLLGDLAAGQRFLNLFGYTGTASVAAAKGGATSTTTVDLNGHYLEWAQRNFAANKLTAARNAAVEADVLQWVAQTDERFGLIYLDPPTFTNSKKMGRATFDVRRDHADLIRLVVRRLLAPGGVLVFACNARRFALDAEALARDHELEDLSRATLAPDFARSARAHHVWRISARQ
jgi:23S rRNA (guanine2445-N2)-methyltransferase / 23S rRNA (guanine2069-N7)-methyltransferase